jgi:predicted Zn-dependent peptidase
MNYFQRTAFLLILTLLAANFTFAQTIAQPRQEKLLNGLKVLIWNEPKAEKVSLRLRIHSGSAFDPKDKMGTMALVADVLFPTEQTRNFFEEDLEGSLEITSNYDYIQINATAKADEFLTILETVATAVSNPAITPENFVKVRDARLKTIEEMQKNPAYVADMAVAKRLLGDFPYGRPQAGTPESLKLIERADLLTAKEKFFTADNATLAITGSVKPDYAYMAARRLFGAWKKADKLIPPTFRQPDAPDSKIFLAEIPGENNGEIRSAIRGLARNDKDFWASVVLTGILQLRYRKDLKNTNLFIRQEAHLLPSLVIMGFPVEIGKSEIKPASESTDLKPPPVPTSPQTSAPNFIEQITQNPISADEFGKARDEVSSEFARKNAADLWLDVDSYKLVSAKDESQKVASVTLADVQRVLERWKKEAEVKGVFTGKVVTKTTQPQN